MTKNLVPPFPPITTPNLGSFPLLLGEPELTEGYFELERQERGLGMSTVARHRNEVALWYRLLTVHRRMLLQGFDFEGRPEPLASLGLRMELVGLGLTYSKAALDGLIVGYYGPAFAAIRHMLETTIVCHFVACWPEQTAAFYAQVSGDALVAPAKMRTMIGKLKKRFLGDAMHYEHIYRSWEDMSTGSHPSGEGIAQLRDDDTGTWVAGATYKAQHCHDGFRHGLPAALGLVFGVHEIQVPDDERARQVEAVAQAVAQGVLTLRQRT